MDRLKRKEKATLNLPPIPSKRYFTISEVSKLCAIEPYVLRYWEQEFSQLRPTKRKGNRRYYQEQDILLIRRIKQLLYKEGFTIQGARTKLIKLSETKNKQSEDSVLSTVIQTLESVLIELNS